MSRSNYDKPFYVDVGTSIVAIRCASNHDVVIQYDYAWSRDTLNLAKNICDRMNREAEIGRRSRNCDRFADELDAQLAFLNEVWLISIDRETMTEQDTYEKWTDEMRTRYGRWLYAPATEQKGETNGSK